jgi:hypothetical protein
VARSLFALVFILPLAAAAACAGGKDSVGAGEQDSTEEDLAQARQVLAILGGPQGKCIACHTATPADVKRWGVAMKTVDTACLAPANLTAAQRLACLRDGPNFSAQKLGLYAAGASMPELSGLFSDPGQASAFVAQVGMPKRGLPALTTTEWTLVKAWVLRGMPQLDQAAAGDAGADGAAHGACTDSTTADLGVLVGQMKTTGWGARHADLRTPMYGCGAAVSPLECLTSLPEITQTVGASGVTQRVRELRRPGLQSHYWVRSSADGRYVGFGLMAHSKVVDLTTAPASPAIDVAAPYDPYFFPGNDGFAFAGVGGNNIVACKQSLLSGAASLSLTEVGCANIGSSVYESIGASLDGVRYFVTTGVHENDDGGNEVKHPLPAAFGASASTVFVPMVNDGIAFRPQGAVTVALPGEGDLMLSPSTLLAATRFGSADGTKQLGYRVHLVKATTAPGGGLTVTAPLGAEICMRGGKASFSFDERFLAAHQYVDTQDPDEAGLPDGSSNIVVADLATGAKVRVTQMKANQYALYPHFRADGWLYFLVRDIGAGVEYVGATDAAIRIAAAHP